MAETDILNPSSPIKPRPVVSGIRVLRTHVVNQIAAGEVIERPASVVKELAENSLDAGATRIAIDLEEGGRRLIRLSDDGRGIRPDELVLAVTPHATSKLREPEELEAIATLGFRGEALASIASVSRLTLTSRAQTTHEPEAAGGASGGGARLVVEGEAMGEVEPCAARPGTTLEVRDLFFNTPARQKFMRGAPTEMGHISDAVQRLALTHPAIGFKLTHNGKTSLDLPPGHSRRERALAILGHDLEEGLIEFESEPLAKELTAEAAKPRGGVDAPMRVWGLAGDPSLARSNTKAQHLCVNGRVVRDRGLGHALKEAYRGLIPPDRHPLAVVMVEMDPRQVDVNVHPAKSEVRFREPSRVHGLVLSNIRRALHERDLTPSVGFNPASPGGDLGKALSWPGGSGLSVHPAPPSPTQFVDVFKRMAPTQKGMVFREVREAMAQEPGQDSGWLGASTASGDLADEPGVATGDLPPLPLKPMPILQVQDSYIVTEDDQGILIVDQHALHERVMFERLRRRVLDEDRPMETQRLLVPAVVEAGPERMARLEGLGVLLESLGVQAEPIGPRQVAVHAFPTLLLNKKVDPAGFLADLLDLSERELLQRVEVEPQPGLEAGRDDSARQREAAIHGVLDMMACKAAVKAGDRLSPEELAGLLAERERVERSSRCPHGRPTTLRLSLQDLAKQFGRT